MSDYEIKTTGIISQELDLAKATSQFARIFKVDTDRAKAVITGGKPRRIGKNLSRERAEQYLEVLARIGIEATVSPYLTDQHSAESPGRTPDPAVTQKINVDSGAATLILKLAEVDRDKPQQPESDPTSETDFEKTRKSRIGWIIVCAVIFATAVIYAGWSL